MLQGQNSEQSEKYLKFLYDMENAQNPDQDEDEAPDMQNI